LKRIVLAAILGLTTTAAWAGLALDKSKFIGVEELKRGLKGYGLTVFTGTKPERFDVEVVDVIPKMRPGQDAVVVRISGHGLEFTGIASGMSGSPVFFKDRLAGALSFGWAFNKGRICGMTPVKHMLETQLESADRGPDEIAAAVERSFGYRSGTPFVPSIFRAAVPGAGQPPKLGEAKARQTYPTEITRPFIPVSCSGLTDEAMRLLNTHLMPAGMLAVAGGSATRPAGSKPAGTAAMKLEPGSALGVRFAEGDMELSGLGTLTFIHEGKTYAFGHGMFQSGAICMPMTNAVVHGFVPSTYMSFKLSSPLATLGALEYDGTAAIVGSLGKKAPMLPMELRVHDNTQAFFGGQWPPAGVSRVHQCRAISHPFYTGIIGAIFLVNFVPWRGGLPRLSTARAVFKWELEDGRKIVFKEMATGERAPSRFASVVMMVLIDLYNNPFKKAKIKGTTVELAWTKGLKTAVIEALEVEEKRVCPGEAVKVQVTLMPYQRKRETVTMEINIPRDTPFGARTIGIGGYDLYLHARVAANVRAFQAHNFDELLKVLNEDSRRDRLYAVFAGSEYGLAMDDAQLPSLPASVLSSLESKIVNGQGNVSVEIVPPEEKWK